MGTANGSTQAKDYCYMHSIAFPEMSYSRHCKIMKVFIINARFNYDLIIGYKFMTEVDFKPDFSTTTVWWYDKFMSFHPRSYYRDNSLIRKVISNEPYAIAEAYMNQANCSSYLDSAPK